MVRFCWGTSSRFAVAIFLLCLHMVESRERVGKLSPVSSHKSINPIMKVLSSRSNYIPKVPSPTPSLWGSGFQQMYFRKTQIFGPYHAQTQEEVEQEFNRLYASTVSLLISFLILICFLLLALKCLNIFPAREIRLYVREAVLHKDEWSNYLNLNIKSTTYYLCT